MRIRYLCVFCILAAGGCVSPEPAFRTRPEYKVLEAADYVASGGDGNTPPHEVVALEKICGWPKAIGALEDLLGRATMAGRLYALFGLYRVDRPLFERYLPRFSTSSEEVAYGFVTCLGVNHHATVKEVVEDIRNGEYSTAFLEQLDEEEKRADRLRSGIDKERLMRELGSEVLGDWTLQCRLAADRSLPIVIEALRSPNPQVRLNAFYCIEAIGPWAEPAIPAVVASLDDSDVEIRRRAAWTLEKIATPAGMKSQLPVLQRKFDDLEEDEEVIAYLTFALSQSGEPAIPILLRVLERPDKEPEHSIRYRAVLSLESFGPAARAAAPALQRIVRTPEESEELREAAERSLAQIGE